MGIIKPEFVIALTIGDNNRLDDFIKKHSKHFSRSVEMGNGYVNYVMFWDGSKEHWDDSDVGDELRKKFLDILKTIPSTTIYHIIDPMDRDPFITKQFIYSDEVLASFDKVKGNIIDG